MAVTRREPLQQFESLSARVENVLRRRLLAGEYPVWSRLVERRLAEELGVSRTPVKEALRRLEREEIVTASPDGVYRPRPPDLARLHDYYEVRLNLERFSIQEAGGSIKAIQRGVETARTLVSEVATQQPEPTPLNELIVGTECGGYDATSGAAANPTVGIVADWLVAQGATVLLDNGKGKGDALRVGIAAASGDILVFIDADGSHDPRDIPAPVQPIVDGEADHVSGSRMLGGSDELHATINQFVRLFGSQVITLSINYTQGVRLTDSQNGFRAIRAEVARSLALESEIPTIEQEMVIKTVRSGYRISEVATHEYVRSNGESNFRVLDVWFQFVKSWLYYLFFWRPPLRAAGVVNAEGPEQNDSTAEESDSPGSHKLSGPGEQIPKVSSR